MTDVSWLFWHGQPVITAAAQMKTQPNASPVKWELNWSLMCTDKLFCFRLLSHLSVNIFFHLPSIHFITLTFFHTQTWTWEQTKLLYCFIKRHRGFSTRLNISSIHENGWDVMQWSCLKCQILKEEAGQSINVSHSGCFTSTTADAKWHVLYNSVICADAAEQFHKNWLTTGGIQTRDMRKFAHKCNILAKTELRGGAEMHR